MDPEGNKVEFVQPPAHPAAVTAPNAIGHHIIHVGYMIHDRAAEDKFYKDILGFKPYWWGGRNGKLEWISQQCPDGHDWMEYMMTRGTRDADRHDRAGTGRDGPLLDRGISVPETFKVLAAGKRLEGAARCGAEDRAGREVPVEYVRS